MRWGISSSPSPGVRMSHHRNQSPPMGRSALTGYRFPAEMDHVTLDRWVERSAPLRIEAARPRRRSIGGRWFLDATYVKVPGNGATSTEPLISVARPPTYSSRHDATSQRSRSSPQHWQRTAHQTRSSRISLKPWRLRSNNSSQTRLTAPINTQTTASSVITVD